MKNSEYECAHCNGIFEKEWSDEEAMQESEVIHGSRLPNEDLAIVCDDCFKEMDLHYNFDKMIHSNKIPAKILDKMEEEEKSNG